LTEILYESGSRTVPDSTILYLAGSGPGQIFRTRPDLGSQIWPEQDSDLGGLDFGSQNNKPNETKIGICDAASCYKEAVQFSASFDMSVFARFDEICGTAMNFVLFFIWLTLTKM